MAGNTVSGAAFGMLLPLVLTPPAEVPKPATITILFVMVAVGSIGAAWQLMRED